MRKLYFAAITIMALGLAGNAAAAPRIIDFEDLPTNDWVVNFQGQKSLLIMPYANKRQWTFGGGGWDRIPLPEDHPSGHAFGYSTTIFESFDVYMPDGGQVIFDRESTIIAPGVWTTIPMRPITYTLTAKFHGGTTLIDNIRIGGEYISPAPEPATWAMMIAGFGLTGAGLRRSRAQRQGRLQPQQAS